MFKGNIPWITTVALNGRYVSEENAVEFLSELALEKSATRLVPANSIMIGTRVGVGKVAINSTPMATNQDIISLTMIDEKIWHKPYLLKSLLSLATYFQSQARGATIKGIKIDTLAG
ncbi:MAG: restriction endonuclease subunit S, partial [Opitutales bacterium]|nr:restriction endonuclease subunit S [Opitutales bacterium]